MPIRLFDKLVSAFGGAYADGEFVALDTTNFDGNLDSNTVNLQLLAQALDDLVVTGGGSDTAEQIRDKLHTLLTINRLNLSSVYRQAHNISADLTLTNTHINSFLNLTTSTTITIPTTVAHEGDGLYIYNNHSSSNDIVVTSGEFPDGTDTFSLESKEGCILVKRNGTNHWAIVGYSKDEVGSGTDGTLPDIGLTENVDVEADSQWTTPVSNSATYEGRTVVATLTALLNFTLPLISNASGKCTTRLGYSRTTNRFKMAKWKRC